MLDGKGHSFGMEAEDNVLDTALERRPGPALRLQRRRVLHLPRQGARGQSAMEKNFTLEQWEIDKGFVLTCQAHCVSNKVVVSYDER